MSTILDQNIQVGIESTYGTSVTPTRAYEAKGDDWKRIQEDLPSVGMRPGMQGEFSDRQKTIDMGATGSIEFDVLNKGFGLLLQAMFGSSVTGPTVVEGTAYRSTHTTTTADPAKSYTVQVQRVDTGDTLRPFTFPGAVITNWSLSHDLNQLLVANLEWDARTSTTATAAASAVSPSGAANFDWTQANVSIGGSEFCVDSLELNANLGLKTDRRLMCATSGGLKKQPKRNAVPVYTGNLMGEFEDLTEYNLWVNGTISEIILTWTGALISGSTNYELKITLPACKFTGDANPVSSLTEITKQPMPFKALYDGSTYLARAEYTSVDTAL